MKAKLLSVLFLFAFIFSATVNSATNSLLNPVGANIRYISMGGAFVGLADDENAIFVNPAGLAFTKGFHLRANLLGGADKSFFQAQQYLKERSDTDPPTIEELKAFNSGENQALQFGSAGALALYGAGWGLTLSADLNTLSEFRDDHIDQQQYLYGKFSLALAKKLWIIGVGTTFNFYGRNEINTSTKYGATEAYYSDSTSYSGFAMDVGAMLKLPLIKAGIAIRNFAGSENQQTDSGTTKSKLDPIVALGASVKFPNLPVLAFLIKDVIASAELDATKNDSPILKLGAEAKFINIPILGHLKARLGSYISGNRVGATLGAGLRLLIADLDLAIKVSKPKDVPDAETDMTTYLQASVGW